MRILSHIRGWSLRRKAAVLLAFAAGVPPLIVAGLLLQHERGIRRTLNEAVLRARVDQVGDTLEALAHGYAGMAKRYSIDPDFVDFCDGSASARARLRTVVQGHLQGILETDPAILGTTILDASGVAIASTDPIVGKDLSFREYFRSALAGSPTPDVFISVPAVGRIPLIAFPAPIKRDAKLVGVYVVLVRAEVFWSVMRAANDKAGPGSFYILFDRFGVRIGHSGNAQLVFHPAAAVDPEAARRMLASHRFQERTAELLAAVEPFPTEVLTETTTFRRYSPTNGSWNMGVSRRFPSLQWTLVAMIPERELEVRALAIVPQALPPTLIGLVLALVGGAMLIRRVVDPIRSLAAAAAALERGEPVGHMLDTSAGAGDEFCALSTAFRSMAESLTERDRSLWAGYRDLRQVLDSVGEGFLTAGPDGSIVGVHSAVTEDWLGPMRVGQKLWDYLEGSDASFARAIELAWRTLGERASLAGEPLSTFPDQLKRGERTFQVAYRSVRSGVQLEHVIVVITDVTAVLAQQIAERQLEAELRQAQKLEAVGQIAAGVAHEINTPIQYIGDGTRFVKDAFNSVAEVLRLHREALGQLAVPAEVSERLHSSEEAADLTYLLEEVPKALVQVLDGVQRVTAIVRAMKEFAHPDQKEMVPTDLNRALAATLEISRNEYKYVAEVETAFGEIPMVLCHAGDLNQVFLNIIVNAAHAIGDVVKGTQHKGSIRVRTHTEESQVVVSISDTGGGIPCEIRDKVFEPFFTTKPIGKGTGQGLAIARSVVKNHGGVLTFESELGKGTTFIIRLPTHACAARAAVAEEPCAPRS